MRHLLGYLKFIFEVRQQMTRLIDLGRVVLRLRRMKRDLRYTSGFVTHGRYSNSLSNPLDNG